MSAASGAALVSGIEAAQDDSTAEGAGGSEQLLAAIGEAAERIVGEELKDDTFRDVLGIVGEAAGVSRVRCYRIHDQGPARYRTSPGVEWCAPGIQPINHHPDFQFSGLDGDLLSWGERFVRGEIVFGIAREFPPAVRKEMTRQGVLSVALVPIRTQRGIWGFLGFDDCVNERRWPADLVSALRILARILGAAFDRKEYCGRQRTLEASYHALLDNLNEGVFRTDERGHFTYLNGAWRTLTGQAPEQAIGRFCGSVVGPTDRQALRRALVALLRRDLASHRCETRLLRTEGPPRWVQISVRRVEDATDGISGLVGTIVDISANKQAEEHLMRAKAEAEAANRAKSEFLSTMSHELRTPLNAVIGLSESLLETRGEPDPARSRKYLELIHSAGRQLFGEINAILDLARLEAGRLTLNPAAVDIGVICAGVVEGVRSPAAEKRLHVEVIRPVGGTIIEADERLLTQALHNIVFNAVKFTPAAGRITVTVARIETGVTVSIADTGIGIAPEKLHLLFKPFSQLDSSLARRFGGAGLGLVLADRFIRLHGGSVSVESEPMSGSRFTINLPSVACALSVQSTGRCPPQSTLAS